jgi:hypothetical protein
MSVSKTYEDMTLVELKQKLRERRAKLGGRKNDLTERQA